MSQLKCGIIGCGRIGCGFDDQVIPNVIRTHAKAYFENTDTKLICLCDIDRNKLKKYGRKFSVKYLYTDSSKMFETQDLDCISICTLANTHLDLVKLAVKNNVKGIIIEKPISDTLSNAEKIIKLCKKSGIVLAVNHQRRFDPFYHKVAQLIKRNELGKIQHVSVVYGGGIANTGSHIFDILRLFFGEIKMINGKFSHNTSPNKNDPNVDLELEFRNGIMCYLHALNTDNFGIAELNVFGTFKRLEIDLITNENRIYEHSKKISDYGRLVLSKKTVPHRRPATDIRLVIKNLVECLKMDNKLLCDGMDGYFSLELIVASMQACENNNKIFLPIKNKDYKIRSR